MNSGWLSALRGGLRERFGVDTRALAAFRMALGGLLLLDLLRRSVDLVAFYTDAGVVPREALATQAPTFQRISVHALWGSAWAQAGLFALAGAFALCLLVGYRTRIATVASLVLLVSLHARNPVILSGGDSLLRHLLLWGALLPLGERWSVDAVRSGEPRERVAGFATAGLLLQVVAVYATNAVFKLRGEMWLRGEAVEQVLLLSRHSTWFGQLLLDVPLAPAVADYAWLALIVCSPLLIATTGARRVVLPVLLATMHLGMVLAMELGVFPLVSIAALLPFLPPSVWDRVSEPPRAPFRRLDRLRPDAPSVPGLSAVRDRLATLVEPLAAALLCALILVNAVSVGYVDLPDGAPAALEEKAWDMFAPRPPADDGWYVMPATLESGRQVDALQREPVDWDRPPDVSQTFPNERWRKLLYQLRAPTESQLQRPLASYLCSRWNRGHDDEMERVRIVYVEYPTQRPGRGERVELGEFAC